MNYVVILYLVEVVLRHVWLVNRSQNRSTVIRIYLEGVQLYALVRQALISRLGNVEGLGHDIPGRNFIQWATSRYLVEMIAAPQISICVVVTFGALRLFWCLGLIMKILFTSLILLRFQKFVGLGVGVEQAPAVVFSCDRFRLWLRSLLLRLGSFVIWDDACRFHVIRFLCGIIYRTLALSMVPFLTSIIITGGHFGTVVFILYVSSFSSPHA